MDGFEVGKRSSMGGYKKLHRERAEYFRLMGLGYSNKAACQAVGVKIGRAHV